MNSECLKMKEGEEGQCSCSAEKKDVSLVPVSNNKKKKKKKVGQRRVLRQIPTEITENEELNACISVLPNNYNFEIHKTVHRILEAKATNVALQFPEGLLMFATTISDILSRFCGVETLIMGDVTYGACCVDDLTAKALGCDFLVHYGHSCLVPTDVTSMNMLYVFVDIKLDLSHFVEIVKTNLSKDRKVAMVATIQFVASLRDARKRFEDYFDYLEIPQAKPLSGGEVLGCTSPELPNVDTVIYLGDGRFHMESVMIQNPHVESFRYDPYSKALTQEYYDHPKMFSLRQTQIENARSAQTFGVILGTLGRQGSRRVLQRVENVLKDSGKEYVVILLSEVFPGKLDLFPQVDAWIQIACPRLSIDWGHHFSKPLLTAYEAEVTLGSTEWKEVYPMDFYQRDGGTWTVRHGEEDPMQKLLRLRLEKEELKSK